MLGQQLLGRQLLGDYLPLEFDPIVDALTCRTV
jgi:hypothetical protein